MRASDALFLLGLLAAGCSCGDGMARTCRSSSECGALMCIDGTCQRPRDGGTGADSGAQLDAAGLDAPPGDTGPPCVATEMPETSCNTIDDDCNGLVDDVDVGMDGFCDCLRIGVIGDPGTLASSSFQAWLEARGTTVTRFGLDAAPLSAAQLAAFDVVILDRLRRDYTAVEADVLRDFVAGGGGVMSMTGYTGGGEDYSRPNTLLASIGIEYLPGLRNGPITMFDPHPLTMGLTSVTFAGGYRVGEVAGASGGTTVVIGRLSDGPAAMAQERGMGRVYVWGDEWVEFDSEWSTMPEITQFWVNTITWLGPRDRCLVIF